MPGLVVTVNSRNFDWTLRRSWKADLARLDPPLIELVGVFDVEVCHTDLGLIRRGTISYEYYWLDRWYNVFRFHEPTGEFRNYYCNISMPPMLANDVLDYVDLDIDILVGERGSVSILDMEEFEENSRRFSFPQTVISSANHAVDELITLIEQRNFPFDHSQSPAITVETS
jgi:protein associated with RNAse G/E